MFSNKESLPLHILSRLQNLMSLDVQYLKTELSVVNLMLKLAEHRGEAERKSQVGFRGLALRPIGRRATVKCISPATNPLRKETATFFGLLSDIGTLFTGN